MTAHADTHHDLDDHDRGLAFDLSTLMDRRGVLRLIAGATVTPLVLAACGGGSDATAPAAAEPAAEPAAASGSCEVIPQETAGPFPGDGSNGPNALAESGIVRNDIRTSFGAASGEATGVPLTINLTVLDSSAGCAPYEGAALYLWHCDAAGNYSMYSEAAADQNYLRGVQVAGADGTLGFTTIFPGCYSGRWPHCHFEVYPSADVATSSDSAIRTSQLALPKDACDAAYAVAGYESSVGNLAQLSLETDNIFSDGVELQLATVSGNAKDGYVAELVVTV